MVILLSLFLGGLLGFFMIRQLLYLVNGTFPDYTGFASCVGAIPIALGTIWLVETVLKRTWHSGQRIELDEREIKIVNRVERDMRLKWSDDVVSRHWTFGMIGYSRVGREKRLPKNWVCLASQVQNSDRRIIVYTYLAKQKAEEYLNGEVGGFNYFQLDPTQVYETSIRSRIGPPIRPDLPSEILTGENGRYWLSEKRRWEQGHEVTPEDYATFVQYVAEFAPEEKIQS